VRIFPGRPNGYRQEVIPAPSRSNSRGEHVISILVRLAGWLLVAAALAYPVDFAVWRTRVAMGNGMGQVSVSQITAAELKGNKEEYYWDGNISLDCSRSLFPEGLYSACWYLRRHSETIARP
jgi:hypothetical protein